MSQPKLKLERDQYGHTPLHLAAAQNNKKKVEKLVTIYGCKVDCIDNSGCTPLFYAAKFQNTDIFKFLIDHGADVNRYNNNSFSPLHCLCYQGQKHMLQYLHAKGIDMKLSEQNPYDDEETPLEVATRTLDRSFIQFVTELDTSRKTKMVQNTGTS